MALRVLGVTIHRFNELINNGTGTGPCYLLMSTISNFSAFALSDTIQSALAAKGYTTPSPIQAASIPLVLEGHDLLACAQTGTGKTASFALPTLDRLARAGRKPFRRGVRCLILTPTRELAVQVADSYRTYGKNLNVKVAMVFGGVSEKPQISTLYQGVDVLVATTGRLLDLHGQGHVDLSQVETFVLDEADRMLDMGFIRDIRKIAALIPKKRQTLLFSATMAPEITSLAQALLHNPKEVRIAPQGTTAENISQAVLFVDQGRKLDLLINRIQSHRKDTSGELSLIFSRTKHGAKNLARKLCAVGIEADSIHGNKSQSARQKALERFRSGDAPVLVATDVAARGIDVKNITLVVNYDLPMEPDAYVHRIGRTARAGASGRALSFCSEEEVYLLREVERLTRRSLAVDAEHPFHGESIEALHRSGARVPKPKNGGQGGRSGGNRPPRNPARGGSPERPAGNPFQANSNRPSKNPSRNRRNARVR